MINKTIIIAIVLILMIISVVSTSIAYAYTGNIYLSYWAQVIPTIDGDIADSEWDDAWTYSFDVGTTINFYLKNDSTYLYMGIEMITTPQLTSRAFTFYFEDDPYQVALDARDDAKKSTFDDFNPTSVLQNDMYGPSWATDSAGPEHNSAYTYTSAIGGTGIAEFRIPLNSGDSQDMAVSPGDIVGFLWHYLDSTTPTPTESYGPFSGSTPYSGTPPSGDPTAWGQLQLAAPGNGESGCFIATASSGDPDNDGRVQTLRGFRDEHLLGSSIGSGLVSTYYKLSPPVAKFIDDNSGLKPAVRMGLLPAVGVSTVALNTSQWLGTALIGTLMLVPLFTGLWIRKRRIHPSLNL